MGYLAFLERMGQVNDLLNAKSILNWDALTKMPPGGAETRAKQLATLSVMARDLLVADDTRGLLDKAEAEIAAKPADSVQAVICRQVREAIDYHLRIPAELVRKRAELGSIGHEIWAHARVASDFSAYMPHLTKTVTLNREMAEYIGYESHPYDALMFRFEPGETVATLKPLFAKLRDGMLPLLRAIAQKDAPRIDFLERHYPADQQLAFGLKMAEKLGYDLNRGRIVFRYKSPVPAGSMSQS
jgi:carboxypeptidase Taq